jgi:anti-anti-sigma factor
MSIRASMRGQTVRISLKGALTLGGGAGSLSRAVAAAIQAGARIIEIDATGVRFLDAAGLGEFVGCRAMAERAGAELRLCGINGKVRDLLRITKLDKRLLQRETVPERFRALRWRIA